MTAVQTSHDEVLSGSPGRLKDGFGRTARDLRVSLTDQCNLRCTYCMPEQAMPWIAKPNLLSDDEIVRLTGIAVTRLGIEEVRLTGGEPLLRPGIVDIVSRIAALQPRPSLSLTTNGIGLERVAPALAAAGLDRINVSLDTLNRDRFKQLARRDRLADVLAGLQAAADAGLSPIKVNSVLIRGINDHEAPDLLAFCLAAGYQLRFIEQMPLDPMHGWSRTTMVSAEEILERLAPIWRLTASQQPRGAAPAEEYLVDSGPATVGIVASVTRPFCGDCDRVRLTADGQLRTCLFARREFDLRALLREGGSDQQLADLWARSFTTKAAGHRVDDPDFRQPSRPMSAIGG
ncbi:MAG: GTP 3',8-cyclase MoaA [Actinomycetes bacterium]